MKSNSEALSSIFGNRLRIRVCGILVENEKILLVKHKYIGNQGILWAPPGGGMKFNQSAEGNLKREFLEETGLLVSVEKFLFVNEFINVPLHAVELFFKVRKEGGDLMTGIDPEMNGKEQIIESVEFLGQEELNSISQDQLHNILHIEKNPMKIVSLKGFYHFYNL